MPPHRDSGGRRRQDDRVVLEAVAWKYRTGSPWRDLPERFGRWSTVFKRFDRWAKAGIWPALLGTPPPDHVCDRGRRSCRTRQANTPRITHQRGTNKVTGGLSNYTKFGNEPADHAIGRSRGGLSTKTHLVADGRGRPLGFVLTGGQVADTIMLPKTIATIRVPGNVGRPRTRPARVRADKGYPSKANRAWLRRRGIKA
jgi:transposase